jgi:tetraacyldisaccharide 4'-kinase
MKQRLAAWLQKQWYGGCTPNVLLMVPAILFRQGVKLRRAAYRYGFKKCQRLPVPVIVVGNISVGGTGKTPLVVWLADFLLKKGYRPGVISRGYGCGELAGPSLVVARSDPRSVGDEPVLIARRTGRPVCVYPARAEAGRALLARSDCDVLICDDGLQHYALARDVEIAVIDGERRFGNGRCLPAGPLRETVERLSEVDLVVCQGRAKPDEFAMTLSGDHAVNLLDETRTKPLAEFADVKLHAVAGIGNPDRFFAYLRGLALSIEPRAFEDHHPFRREDIWFDDGLPVLMTEKDAVKCRDIAGAQHWYVPVKARLPLEFGEKLLNLLRARCDGQETAGDSGVPPLQG